MDWPDVDRLLEKLSQVNKFRRRAAHDEPISADEWGRGRELVLGHDGVLASLASVIPAAAAASTVSET
jgi:hypothetical protein